MANKKQRSWSRGKKSEAQANRAIDVAVRQDLKQMSDPGRGTSPGSLGIVKASSEESRHETCFECGYSSGRHGRFCSRR